VLGVSGRAMLEALVAGERDPQVLAELARGRLRAKQPAASGGLPGVSGWMGVAVPWAQGSAFSHAVDFIPW
jgi:hypothetical protein